MAVLFITHDMGVVAEIADRTLVMRRGDMVETGDTQAVFANARHPYTRALLAAVPRLGSMNGRYRPLRFATVDPATGKMDESAETPDTVASDQRPVLEVQGLTKRFDIRSGVFSTVSKRVHALENISFSLHGGETLAIVGESGCGKSTAGRSILGLLRPSAGSILVDGEEIVAAGESALRKVRRKVQMIFQDPFASLDPRLSVGDAIAEPLVSLGLGTTASTRDKIATLLERVGLSADMATRFPHEFSGGQRQRICIARALAVEPKVIVADESVSALDVSVKAQVINLMLDLQASMKLAYLFISHDMAVVERLAHRVAVMYLGEIVEVGSREAVFGRPQHPYTRKLMAAVPVPDPARRKSRHGVSNDEIKSPVHGADYIPPMREYRHVGQDHSVQVWGDEWAHLGKAEAA